MRVVWNCLLVFGSVVVGLALAEASLRWFHPRYEQLATPFASGVSPSSLPSAPSAYWYPHPDTGRRHAVMRSNLGGRQHRNFSERDLAAGVNIAFFGDSFVANIRLPAMYSFTEVLDYLLNAHESIRSEAARSLPRRFNVLNFGVDGSGPGTQYLRYRGLPFKQHLRHVFYLYYRNDPQDLRRSRQWELDGRGRLVQRLQQEAWLWRRALSRLHLAYLALDVRHRLGDLLPTQGRGQQREANMAAPASMSDSETLRVFDALLRRWRREVEANGGAFHIVLLPWPPERANFRSPLLADWDVVALGDCFAEATDGDYRPHVRFKRDQHWNEQGNMLAARCLHRYLERTLGLPSRSRHAVARRLHAYYHAFLISDAWRGQRYAPAALRDESAAFDGGEAQRVFARYYALAENAVDRATASLLTDYRTITATAPAARSLWNVYALRARREIAYLKEPCSAADIWETFFLRVRPTDGDRFLHLPIGFWTAGVYPTMFNGKCLMTMPLPALPIGTVWTGNEEPAGDRRWEVIFYWDLARLRRAFRATVGRRPEASSVFAVHHIGAALIYVREPCAAADVRQRFFLHVFERAKDSGAPDRFANLDFDFVQRGALIDDRCIAVVPLAAREVARVRTGQVGPEGETWKVEFTVAAAE